MCNRREGSDGGSRHGQGLNVIHVEDMMRVTED